MKTYITVALLLLVMLPLCSAPAYAMPTVTVQGDVWQDANCDGMRQDTESTFTNQANRIYLFAAGTDSQVHTSDDQVIEQSDIGMDGTYLFTLGTTDVDYRITILAKDHPAGFVPAPYQAGDDRNRDNDLTRPLAEFPDYWSTNAFQMDATATVTGIDIGLCSVQYTSSTYLPLLNK